MREIETKLFKRRARLQKYVKNWKKKPVLPRKKGNQLRKLNYKLLKQRARLKIKESQPLKAVKKKSVLPRQERQQLKKLNYKLLKQRARLKKKEPH